MKDLDGGPGGVRTLDLMTASNPADFYHFHLVLYFPLLNINSGLLLSLKVELLLIQ